MPFKLIYEIVGNVPSEVATHEVHLPDTFSLANYTTFAVAMATALNAFIKGKILSATLSVDIDLTALAEGAPASSSDVEEKAKFQFVCADGNETKVTIPAISDNFVIDTTHQIDQTDTDVANFIAAMESGIAVTGGTIQPCDIAESSITDTLLAEEIFTRSSRRAS